MNKWINNTANMMEIILKKWHTLAQRKLSHSQRCVVKMSKQTELKVESKRLRQILIGWIWMCLCSCLREQYLASCWNGIESWATTHSRRVVRIWGEWNIHFNLVVFFIDVYLLLLTMIRNFVQKKKTTNKQRIINNVRNCIYLHCLCTDNKQAHCTLNN